MNSLFKSHAYNAKKTQNASEEATVYFAWIDRVTIANEKASGQWERNGLTLPDPQCHTAPAGTVFLQPSHSLKTKSQIISLNMGLKWSYMIKCACI